MYLLLIKCYGISENDLHELELNVTEELAEKQDTLVVINAGTTVTTLIEVFYSCGMSPGLRNRVLAICSEFGNVLPSEFPRFQSYIPKKT